VSLKVCWNCNLTYMSGGTRFVWNCVEVQERNCKTRLEVCRYACLTWSRRQFPVIQNIMLQQENHSRDNTTMTRDIKYSNWSEFLSYSHPILPAEFVAMYPSKLVSA